ncbi:MAG TPA: hypothetical protein VK737_11870 [Opitutales bacterium]|jgi:peptidyl-prolyl cis-trans isomerase D|nr:hypothetical protein [Opitutales bacterium]
MITWFQRVFGKHHKYILMAFLGILLLSFIVTIGAVPRGSMTAAGGSKQMFLGVNVNSMDEMRAIDTAIVFSAEHLYNQTVENQQIGPMREQRIALKYLADKWQIPDPSSQELQDFIQTLPAFLDPDGKYSPSLFGFFSDEVQKLPPAERDADVAILTEDCRLGRVQHILGGPGLSLPGLAQVALLQIQASQDNFKFDLETATLDLAKFEPVIETDPVKLDALLKSMYDADPTKFKQPAQAQLSYLKFAAVPVLEPTAAVLKDYATQHKDAYPALATNTMSTDDLTNLAKDWRAAQKVQAETAAKSDTQKFAQELLALKAQPNSPEFATLIKKYSQYNLVLQHLPLLIQGTPAPDTSPIPDDKLQEAAFGGPLLQYPFYPVELSDGAALLFADQPITPPKDSTFEQAKDTVKKAYVKAEKAKQLTTHGDDVNAAITKAMAAGQSFHDAAVAQNLTFKDYPDVTDTGLRDAAMEIFNPAADKDTPSTAPLASMGRDMIGILANPDPNSGVSFLLQLHLGEVSKMQLGADSGMIFHAAKREPAQIEADAPETKAIQNTVIVRESNSNAGASIDRLLQAAAATLKPAGS